MTKFNKSSDKRDAKKKKNRRKKNFSSFFQKGNVSIDRIDLELKKKIESKKKSIQNLVKHQFKFFKGKQLVSKQYLTKKRNFFFKKKNATNPSTENAKNSSNLPNLAAVLPKPKFNVKEFLNFDNSSIIRMKENFLKNKNFFSERKEKRVRKKKLNIFQNSFGLSNRDHSSEKSPPPKSKKYKKILKIINNFRSETLHKRRNLHFKNLTFDRGTLDQRKLKAAQLKSRSPINFPKKRFFNTIGASKSFKRKRIGGSEETVGGERRRFKDFDIERQKIEFRKFEMRKREKLRGLLYNQKSLDMKNNVLPQVGARGRKEVKGKSFYLRKGKVGVAKGKRRVRANKVGSFNYL